MSIFQVVGLSFFAGGVGTVLIIGYQERHRLKRLFDRSLNRGIHREIMQRVTVIKSLLKESELETVDDLEKGYYMLLHTRKLTVELLYDLTFIEGYEDITYDIEGIRQILEVREQRYIFKVKTNA